MTILMFFVSNSPLEKKNSLSSFRRCPSTPSFPFPLPSLFVELENRPLSSLSSLSYGYPFLFLLLCDYSSISTLGSILLPSVSGDDLLDIVFTFLPRSTSSPQPDPSRPRFDLFLDFVHRLLFCQLSYLPWRPALALHHPSGGLSWPSSFASTAYGRSAAFSSESSESNPSPGLRRQV